MIDQHHEQRGKRSANGPQVGRTDRNTGSVHRLAPPVSRPRPGPRPPPSKKPPMATARAARSGPDSEMSRLCWIVMPASRERVPTRPCANRSCGCRSRRPWRRNRCRQGAQHRPPATSARTGRTNRQDPEVDHVDEVPAGLEPDGGAVPLRTLKAEAARSPSSGFILGDVGKSGRIAAATTISVPRMSHGTQRRRLANLLVERPERSPTNGARKRKEHVYEQDEHGGEPQRRPERVGDVCKQPPDIDYRNDHTCPDSERDK